MNIKPVYRQVPLNRIDLNNRFYSLVPFDDPDVDRQRNPECGCGIMNPPLLKEEADNRFSIVAGRRKIMTAMSSSGEDTCYCLVIQAGAPKADLLILAFQGILQSRPATPVEKAIFLQKIAEEIGIDRAMAEIGPRLELSKQLTAKKLEKLLSLDQKILEAVHNGDLDLKNALKLTELSPPGRKSLFKIIDLLRLSSSNQRKLIDQCCELAKRQNRSIEAVLADSECDGIINHPTANPPQRTAMLMNWLNGKCYPRLSEAEAEFRGFIAKLALPKGIGIEHAPSFEKDSLTMTIEFADQEELAEKWAKIRLILQDDMEE